MRPEWEGRLNNWLATLEKEFYEPLGELALEGFCTYDLLDPDEAAKFYTDMAERAKKKVAALQSQASK